MKERRGKKDRWKKSNEGGIEGMNRRREERRKERKEKRKEERKEGGKKERK